MVKQCEDRYRSTILLGEEAGHDRILSGSSYKLCPHSLSLVMIAVAALVLVSSVAVGARNDADLERQWRVVDRRPAAGEQCLVCNRSVRAGGIVELRYRGRRFYVAEKWLATFKENPSVFLSKIKARGALFDEEALVGRTISWGWMAGGLYVVVGLFFAALCGFLAIRRREQVRGWFFAGLALNVVAVIALAIKSRRNIDGNRPAFPTGLGKASQTREPVACHHCGATNHPSAECCLSCQAELVPEAISELGSAGVS